MKLLVLMGGDKTDSMRFATSLEEESGLVRGCEAVLQQSHFTPDGLPVPHASMEALRLPQALGLREWLLCGLRPHAGTAAAAAVAAAARRGRNDDFTQPRDYCSGTQSLHKASKVGELRESEEGSLLLLPFL